MHHADFAGFDIAKPLQTRRKKVTIVAGSGNPGGLASSMPATASLDA
jgi:hypothetical protein